MLFNEPSVLSIVAATYYIVVAAACVLAGQKPTWLTGNAVWKIAVIFFLLLAAMRFAGAEDWLRDTLRHILGGVGSGGQDRLSDFRRVFQLPMTFAIALLIVTVAVWRTIVLRRGWASYHDRLRNFTWLAMVVMGGLVLLRIASLHVTDALLFGGFFGPVRLNWIIDLGASTTVLICSVLAARLAARSDRDRNISVSNYWR